MQTRKQRMSGLMPALLGFACVILLAGSPVVAGSGAANTNSVSPPSTKATQPAKPDKAKRPAAARKLSGAELYSIHCNRCHPERYPTERTAAQWKTIMLHMRVRANLPGEQARIILKYLQDNSGR